MRKPRLLLGSIGVLVSCGLLLVACASLDRREAGAPPPAAPIVVSARAAPGARVGARLDELLAASWAAAGVAPAPAADDGAFLRRVSLDLAGRIPSLHEARAFLDDGALDKRARLVDRLLASPAFAARWGDLYADLLFGTDARRRVEKRFGPRAFLVAAFEENRPYDRLAAELLTADGSGEDDGAAAFVAARLRGGGGPEAIAGAAARIFLGLQIQCAQCHDHPYDARWKQEDFYGLVAYFAGTRVRAEPAQPASQGATDVAREGAGEMAGAMDADTSARRSIVLVDLPRGEARMQRPGSAEGVLVKPRFLGAALGLRPGETRRQAFARAVIGSDLFAKAMVARTWAQLFGRGLVEPWDDLGAERDPAHPPPLLHLAEAFRDGGYDVRALVRTIVLSAAYGRSAAGSPSSGADASLRAFARMGTRPLSADQLVASLLVATGVDGAARRASDDRAGSRRVDDAFRDFRFAFADDEMAEVDRFDGSLPQALLLLNGPLTNAGSRARRAGVLSAVLAAHRDPAARLEDLFLAAYTRAPRPDERALLLGHVAGQGGDRRAWEDVYFSLLTSAEAVTNH
jgi:hypothetical protein